jgi:prepilin-type N-terminal cleavage/methylation domain-containing protein
MKYSPRNAGFTLMELMVSAAVACFVGIIIYAVATENLVAFEKNFSINRSYSDGRRSLDRLSVEMQSAGHVPVLVDATGASTSTTPAPGIRFWRYSSNPEYLITTPTLTSTSITISLIAPGTSSTVILPPVVGDMITVAGLGFQAQVVTVAASGSSAVLTFSGTVVNNTSPTLTTLPNGTLSCLDWHSVAFITVGTQLRYYSTFISGTSNVNTTPYEVITNLIPNAPALPFSLGPSPSVNIDLYTQAPEYNNRNLNTADTYTYLCTALSPRNPALLRSPY